MVEKASAPGKIILFGEHFVVKGIQSIATAIDLRVTVSLEERSDGYVYISSPRAGIDAKISLESLLRAEGVLAPLAGLLRYFKDRYGVDPRPFNLHVESQIPVGAGLGSSAAFSAAFSLAYSRMTGLTLTRKEIAMASLEAEKIAHGRPSGIDSTIAVYGGSILYVKGEEPKPLTLRLPEGVSIIVADTGRERSTRQVVEHVLSVAERTRPASDHIYSAAGEIVRLALQAFASQDARLLGILMDVNQGLLYSVGASSYEIEKLLFAARRAGALGAKLTGAGWGGSIIALVEDFLAGRVKEELLRSGAREVFSTGIGAEGVKSES